MTLNGEMVPALTNWQAVTLAIAALLIAAGWRALRRFTGQVLRKM